MKTAALQESGYATLESSTNTLRIERLLPGPIERVWAYLTESELRRKWLASGEMEMRVGAAFELVWRNDELTDPPGHRPDGFGEEHSMKSKIVELDPPRRIAFTWNNSDGVAIDLVQQGAQVLLTLVHSRLNVSRESLLKHAAGWHGHLDILVARVSGTQPQPFWDTWLRLKADYESIIDQVG